MRESRHDVREQRHAAGYPHLRVNLLLPQRKAAAELPAQHPPGGQHGAARGSELADGRAARSRIGTGGRQAPPTGRLFGASKQRGTTRCCCATVAETPFPVRVGLHFQPPLALSLRVVGGGH